MVSKVYNFPDLDDNCLRIYVSELSKSDKETDSEGMAFRMAITCKGNSKISD